MLAASPFSKFVRPLSRSVVRFETMPSKTLPRSPRMLCEGPRSPFRKPPVEVAPVAEADCVVLAPGAKPNGSSMEFRFTVFVAGVNLTMFCPTFDVFN